MLARIGIAAIALGFGLAPGWTYAQESILIGAPGFDHPIAIVASRILPEAYGKLGYKVRFVDLPPQRALAEFDSGALDAFIFSDPGFPEDHPSAVRVDVPIAFDDFLVFAKDPNLVVNGWNSLSRYTIGYLSGMIVVEARISGMRSDPSLSPTAVIQKLRVGRTDVAVMPRYLGLNVLRTLGIKDIFAIGPPLERVPIYHFVGAKRADIVPALASVLAGMAAEGRIEAEIERVESELHLR